MSATCTVLPFPTASEFGRRSALRKNLLRALRVSQSPVIVDLSGHSTLDHEDVDLVLECVAQAAGRDTELVLVAGSAAVRIVLDVVRVSALVRVVDSLAEALSDPAPFSKVAQEIQSSPFELSRSA